MTTNQTTQADPGARARVIKLGLDVHASLIVVVRQVDEQASQPPVRMPQSRGLSSRAWISTKVALAKAGLIPGLQRVAPATHKTQVFPKAA
jgi:hypothetical protein